MPVDFTAIDFETANSSPASACSVGLVRVRNGVVVAAEGWLIRPVEGHDAFLEWNVRIHGITPEDVSHAPTWGEQFDRLRDFAGDDVLVAHNARFDVSVLRGASEITGIDCPPFRSLCSLQVARKTYDLDSYRLPLAAAAAGFGAFQHHNASADAAACAQIVIDAAQRKNAHTVEELARTLGVTIATGTEPVKKRAVRTQKAVPAAESVSAGATSHAVV